ncbi:MAG TPA: hypothetical protein VJ919_15300 [Tangfeifania sp.]|nr:hypothetical protein [Tangfeifania sp.]
MKKLLLLMFMAALFSGALQAAVTESNEDITGEWKYESPHAPYGYEKGSIIISEKEGKLAGEIKFADGYKLPLKNVSYKDGVFKCSLTIDYNDIAIKATFEGSKMKGTADSPEGALPFTAEKAKE